VLHPIPAEQGMGKILAESPQNESGAVDIWNLLLSCLFGQNSTVGSSLRLFGRLQIVFACHFLAASTSSHPPVHRQSLCHLGLVNYGQVSNLFQHWTKNRNFLVPGYRSCFHPSTYRQILMAWKAVFEVRSHIFIAFVFKLPGC
jgi:hypothetical protein